LYDRSYLLQQHTHIETPAAATAVNESSSFKHQVEIPRSIAHTRRVLWIMNLEFPLFVTREEISMPEQEKIFGRSITLICVAFAYHSLKAFVVRGEITGTSI
jgi:hypothetical protein